MASVVNRKSLMLDEAEYAAISKFAKQARVPRPLVVRALLAMSDGTALLGKLQEVRAAALAENIADREKRQKLSALVGGLGLDQIEKLLALAQQQGVQAGNSAVSDNFGPAGEQAEDAGSVHETYVSIT